VYHTTVQGQLRQKVNETLIQRTNQAWWYGRKDVSGFQVRVAPGKKHKTLSEK
jgi:hypothetical protein